MSDSCPTDAQMVWWRVRWSPWRYTWPRLTQICYSSGGWESGGNMRMSLMQHFALQSTTSNELQSQSHILDQALGMETLDGCWNLRVSHPFILLSLRSIYWHFTICLQCPRNWRSNYMLYSARYKLNKCIPRVTAKCKKTQTLTQSVQWEEVQNELSSV